MSIEDDNADTVITVGTVHTVLFKFLLWAGPLTVIAVMGLVLQFYLAMHRIRKVERVQAATSVVVSGVTQAQRDIVKTLNQAGE